MTRPFELGEPGVPATPWGTTLFLSLGLHVFGIVLAVALPRLVPRAAASPVYVVDLVSLPGGPANASPPPATPASPAGPAPLPAPPKDEKAIKIPDKEKKAEPRKTPEPKSTPAKPKPSPTAAPAPTKPAAKTPEATPQAQGSPAPGASMSGVTGGTGAAGGGFGGSGSAQAGAEDFYKSVVTRNIENAWKKPIYPPAETGTRTFSTRIHLVLTSSGRVSSVEILIPSGYEAMDRSVLEAVHDAMFPPFPSNIGRPSMPFIFELVLTRD